MNIITIILALSTIDAVVIALVCRVFSIQQKKQLTKYEIALSDDRLIYIRKMIDTLYTYNHNPEKLRKHIIELMKADVLIGRINCSANYPTWDSRPENCACCFRLTT